MHRHIAEGDDVGRACGQTHHESGVIHQQQRHKRLQRLSDCVREIDRKILPRPLRAHFRSLIDCKKQRQTDCEAEQRADPDGVHRSGKIQGHSPEHAHRYGRWYQRRGRTASGQVFHSASPSGLIQLCLRAKNMAYFCIHTGSRSRISGLCLRCGATGER